MEKHTLEKFEVSVDETMIKREKWTFNHIRYKNVRHNAYKKMDERIIYVDDKNDYDGRHKLNYIPKNMGILESMVEYYNQPEHTGNYEYLNDVELDFHFKFHINPYGTTPDFIIEFKFKTKEDLIKFLSSVSKIDEPFQYKYVKKNVSERANIPCSIINGLFLTK